jgi:PTS system ascorbate-specific IIB component
MKGGRTMLSILTVCGAGLGSSFACQMSIEAVLKDLGVKAKLDHTDISSVGGAKADIILSGKNFEKQFERYTLDCPTIFLDRLVDKNEIKTKLVPVLKELGEL